MTSFKQFEEIMAWKRARELTKKIYKLSTNEKFEKDYMLKDQIRRASVSVMANIAEGYERRGDKEFIRFLNISKGSLAEVSSHLYVAYDVEYIDKSTLPDLLNDCNDISKIISGLISYLKKSIIKPDKSLTTLIL